MSKKKYKITNWSQYNNALKSRGSLTFWVAEKLDSPWYDINTDKKWGKSNKYSDFSIKLMVTAHESRLAPPDENIPFHYSV